MNYFKDDDPGLHMGLSKDGHNFIDKGKTGINGSTVDGQKKIRNLHMYRWKDGFSLAITPMCLSAQGDGPGESKTEAPKLILAKEIIDCNSILSL